MDEKKKIKITISGPSNSGKSTVAMIIKLALKAAGIEFDIEGTVEEYEDKGQEACILNNFPDKVNKIKNNCQVTINQTNLNKYYPGGGEMKFTSTHKIK